MDIQFHRILAESRILHTFTQFLMFQFTQRKKQQIAQGNCLLLQSKKSDEQQGNIYLKMNNLEYLKKVNSNLFVRIKYEKSTAYIFFHQTNQNIVYALTTLNKSPYLPILDQLLTRKATIIEYSSPSLKYQIKLKIDYHCEKIQENQIIIYYNTTAKIGKTIGNFFGSISQKLTKTSQSAEITITKKAETFSRQSLSAETRSKWQTLKQKASGFNDKITDLVKPVNQKASEIASKVSESYNKSQNSIIKSIRQFSKQAQESINQGYIAEAKQVPSKETGPDISEQFESSRNQKKELKEGMINGQYPVV